MATPDTGGTCVQCGKLGRRCIIATVDRVAELTKRADTDTLNATSHAAEGGDDTNGGDRPSFVVDSHVPAQLSVSSSRRAGDEAIPMPYLDTPNTHHCKSSPPSQSVRGTRGSYSDGGLTHFDLTGWQSSPWMDHEGSLLWNSFGVQEQEFSLPGTFDALNPYVDSTGSKDLWNHSQIAVDWPYNLRADDIWQSATPQVTCPPENIVWCPQHREPIPDNTPQLIWASSTDWSLSEIQPTFTSG